MGEHFLASRLSRTFTVAQASDLTEEAAFQQFQMLRWGSLEQQVCPWCAVVGSHDVRRHRRQWVCRDCGKSFSVTSNSLFADRKLSLRQILIGLAYFLNSPKGIAILQLARHLDVTPRTAAMFLGKLREGLVRSRDLRPLTGTVHADGAHFCAKPRRPNRREKITDEEAQARLSRKRAIYRTPADARNWKRRMELRRIVMVFRSVHAEPGKGGKRTIVSVARTENEQDATAMARRFVARDALVMTDEAPAFSSFSNIWKHQVVCHAVEYSTADGINENQAESYFSRLRRWEYGVSHRATPKYLMDYACEMAWREDTRRADPWTRLRELMGKMLSLGLSIWWRGYHQGHHRADELLCW
jgi:transposase-like protein